MFAQAFIHLMNYLAAPLHCYFLPITVIVAIKNLLDIGDCIATAILSHLTDEYFHKPAFGAA